MMPKPILSIITAMDNNRLIGKKNALPWHLPEDLAFFKKTTLGKPIVMGRKTFESIGKPLPGRTNIVISRNLDYSVEGCVCLTSIDSVLEYCKDEEEIMLIGGASLYEQWLPYADKMYITLINGEFEGDAWFPDYQPNLWETICSESHKQQNKPHLEFKFIKLSKNK